MSGTIVITRMISAAELDAALALRPQGSSVGVNPSYDVFAQESIPVEWEFPFDGDHTTDEQRSAIAAVDTLLVQAGLTIHGGSNGVTF